MIARDSSRAGEYILCPARSINDESLVKFGASIWPEPASSEKLLTSWWRNAAPECAVAAIHQPTESMVGICCGRPCQWVIGGQIHPAVSICDWYVEPGHEGKLLGRRMLRRFEVPGAFLNAISISDVAIAYLNRLGWVGPCPSSLMTIPLPGLGRVAHLTMRRPSGVAFQEYTVASNQPLATLGTELDRIEHGRAHDARAHMCRGAAEWSWRLSIYGNRVYRFCVARRGTDPVGYVVVRRMARPRKGMGRLPGAIISDLVAIDDDHVVLQALARRAVSIAADLGVAIAFHITTSSAHQRALTAVGFLSPDFPILGRVLKRRAPVFMWSPRGPGQALVPQRVDMTFADSTLDLDL